MVGVYGLERRRVVRNNETTQTRQRTKSHAPVSPTTTQVTAKAKKHVDLPFVPIRMKSHRRVVS